MFFQDEDGNSYLTQKFKETTHEERVKSAIAEIERLQDYGAKVNASFRFKAILSQKYDYTRKIDRISERIDKETDPHIEFFGAGETYDSIKYWPSDRVEGNKTVINIYLEKDSSTKMPIKDIPDGTVIQGGLVVCGLVVLVGRKYVVREVTELPLCKLFMTTDKSIVSLGGKRKIIERVSDETAFDRCVIPFAEEYVVQFNKPRYNRRRR